MKRIIDGVRYDTEKATLVCTARNSAGYGDFRHWKEHLYKTSKNAWFIQGEGGPMSRWADNDGNGNSSSGEGILPVSPELVMEWLEQNEKIEKLEEHFGSLIKDA
jgi:hypothetical protein